MDIIGQTVQQVIGRYAKENVHALFLHCIFKKT